MNINFGMDSALIYYREKLRKWGMVAGSETTAGFTAIDTYPPLTYLLATLLRIFTFGGMVAVSERIAGGQSQPLHLLTST